MENITVSDVLEFEDNSITDPIIIREIVKLYKEFSKDIVGFAMLKKIKKGFEFSGLYTESFSKSFIKN